jgi:hypothetical protein
MILARRPRRTKTSARPSSLAAEPGQAVLTAAAVAAADGALAAWVTEALLTVIE